MLDLTKLNEEQQVAIRNTHGPLLVLAGAGTGKTTVITYKIAYLLEQGICLPDEILAVTFTNKAANQMQQRVEKLCGYKLPYIGTFHSIALKMLRSYANILGMNSDLNVASYQEQLKLMKNIYLDYKIDEQILEHKVAHQIITTWKDLNLMPDQVSSRASSVKDKLALEIYLHYQKYLSNSGLVDFSDILLYTNHIFQNYAEIRQIYQNKFKYILIDEYQDTNKAQQDWIDLIVCEPCNICCVGDDDQSIYSWRGAQIANILNFEKRFNNTVVITLSKNYRSTQNILDVAQSLISHNNNRYDKKLISGNAHSAEAVVPIRLILAQNTESEAEFIAQELLKLTAMQTSAVLVRTNFQTRVLEDIFTRRAVPYTIVGSLRFYDLKEIKDALAYIRVSINCDDDLALERIINTPKRSIGPATLVHIRQNAIANKLTMFASIKDLLNKNNLTKKVTAEMLKLVALLADWKIYFQNMSPSLAAEKVLAESGYMQMLEQNTFEYQKIDNIKELLVALSEYSTVKEFIDYIALADNPREESGNGRLDELVSVVKIMTIHAAKGLEFDAVFLPNWSEGVLPSSRSLASPNSIALEEERRIAYVAITRAKSMLYILNSLYAKSFGNDCYYINQEPSRFVQEIDAHLLMKENYPKFTPAKVAFLPGNAILHKIFGKGLIIKVLNSETFEVGFQEGGTKVIHKDFLELSI